MSKIFVDQVDPKTATTLTLGTSGDTVSIPSGVTIANSGTATGFGVALTGSTDNQVVTVTGADAIAGETNFIYNGTIVGCGADGANADLGAGIHIRISDTGASVDNAADGLVIEDNGAVGGGLSILSATDNYGTIAFGDSGDNNIGKISYNHTDNSLRFSANASERMRIDDDGDICVGKAVPVSASELGGVTLAPLGRVNISYTGTAGHGFTTYFNGNGEIGSISGSGSATAFNTSSDYRLKENETAITDGIDRVKQLKPYKFNFKVDATKTLDGFFAHEVSSIVPEAITGEKDAIKEEKDKDGNDIIIPQGIDQAKLVPLLTSALQEAITKIETLESKVTALENK
jgi:sorbitol-specific phosphotransferase system component IIA